jgi:hypothetical protein
LFDLVSALAGVVALIILGPRMLISAGVARVPEADELMRLEGTALAC